MKIAKILTLIGCVIALFLTGCGQRTREEQKHIDLDRFSRPSLVGKLPDGREVFVVVRDMQNTYHYIYFVGEIQSNNYSVRNGKTVRQQIEVMIDGKKYKEVTE